jgi:hypothetical protein
MNHMILMGVFLCTTFLDGLLDAQPSPPTVAPTVYVGFLDDAREEMANWEPGVAHVRIIRPAFEKVEAAWRPVNASSVPAQMSWTIAFDGRSLGQVKSEALCGLRPGQRHGAGVGHGCGLSLCKDDWTVSGQNRDPKSRAAGPPLKRGIYRGIKCNARGDFL